MPSSPVAEGRRARGRADAPTGARPRRTSALVAACAALLALGACSSGPAPKLYVLEPVVVGSDAARTPGAIDALGTATVALPGYARDPRIASRDGDNGVSVDDDHRWAEPPDEAITRLFAERLRSHADATVLVMPWPRNFAPDARIEIDFDRLLREPSGGVDAAGYIRLLSGNGHDVIDVRPFRIVRRGTSTDPTAYFVAVAAVVDDLARAAVEALRAATPA